MGKKKPFTLARSFRKNNERRFELINKRHMIDTGLTEREEQELEALQEWVRSYVDIRHPQNQIHIQEQEKMV